MLGDDSGESKWNIIILYLSMASIQQSSAFLAPADICDVSEMRQNKDHDLH